MSNLTIIRANCFKCKGDILKCHPPRCPQRLKAFALNDVKQEFKNKIVFEGENPPSFFVGSTNYPDITISPMISVGDITSATIIDEPDNWQTQYNIPDIVNFRTHLIRAKGRRIDARESEFVQNSLLEKSRELVLSAKPVYSHFKLEKPLNYNMKFNSYTQPIGPGSKLVSLETDTPKIDQKVDYYTSDTDLLASDGITNLFDYGLSVTRINRILSAGILGIKGQRKIVPTRWSITATDDQVGKYLIEKIKNYTPIDDYRVFESYYLDNHFITFMFPRRWSYEFLEAWNDSITGDYELYKGRKDYASHSAGGYYASRLAILEYLDSIKRQAEVYSWRYVGGDYFLPLGVWQVRENVRSGMNEYKSFGDISDVLKYISPRLKLPFAKWKASSYLFNIKKRQKDLFSFVNNN
jgi:hypothetical protein